MILIYDGSFEGFLSLVYEVYYKKLQPTRIYKKLPNELILEELIEIETSKKNSIKVLAAIKEKFPKKALEKILNIFLCDTREFELDLLHYIILGFKNPKDLFNINIKTIFNLRALEKELFSLVHRMYAYARFEELEDGTLYAKIDSKFNVLLFLARHFMKRFNNQNFIIHDVKRKLAFIKNKDYIQVQEVASFETPKFSENEEKFQKLWKSFFNAVSIKERENLKLQQNQVPLYYRTYMSEFLNN
jgi:probable DNA metabolism protein